MPPACLHAVAFARLDAHRSPCCSMPAHAQPRLSITAMPNSSLAMRLLLARSRYRPAPQRAIAVAGTRRASLAGRQPVIEMTRHCHGARPPARCARRRPAHQYRRAAMTRRAQNAPQTCRLAARKVFVENCCRRSAVIFTRCNTQVATLVFIRPLIGATLEFLMNNENARDAIPPRSSHAGIYLKECYRSAMYHSHETVLRSGHDDHLPLFTCRAEAALAKRRRRHI